MLQAEIEERHSREAIENEIRLFEERAGRGVPRLGGTHVAAGDRRAMAALCGRDRERGPIRGLGRRGDLFAQTRPQRVRSLENSELLKVDLTIRIGAG